MDLKTQYAQAPWVTRMVAGGTAKTGRVRVGGVTKVHEQLVESTASSRWTYARLEMAPQHAKAVREREAALETIMDRDSTILKFRELVQKMTEQYTRPGPSWSQARLPRPSSRTPPRARARRPRSSARSCTRRASTRSKTCSCARAHAGSRADMLAACLPDHFMATAGKGPGCARVQGLELQTCSCALELTQARALQNAGRVSAGPLHGHRRCALELTQARARMLAACLPDHFMATAVRDQGWCPGQGLKLHRPAAARARAHAGSRASDMAACLPDPSGHRR
ncbi:unnamed protein product [Chrysodeixis includens]|uniref:Uncharacterized protein n=1 Tax=Chrysodeixis includens TaxID=689277 RepID=A0A9N8Q0Y2_CHRIL|nr:unnamed protein product [Chrysodeixis includens]